MSHFLPKDFVETREGLVFAVVEGEPEEQRVLATLRYRRTGEGWRKLSSNDAERLLSERHPHYLYYSRSRDVRLHGVHRDLIARHHRPRQRLQAILQENAGDVIEQKLARLLSLFAERGIDSAEIGVTGSLLIGAQRPDSDIDLVFYRAEPFFRARDAIRRLIADGALESLDERLWRDAYDRRGCALSYDEYCWHERRKYNKAAIGQTKFDISLMTPGRWQDLLRYRKHRRIGLTARIADDSGGFDYPARYRLDHPAVEEAVSYTATYAGQALHGEWVEIRGQLEVSSLGHLRIVIGTDREASNEYLKVLPSPQRRRASPVVEEPG